jgi:hypothetical protein
MSGILDSRGKILTSEDQNMMIEFNETELFTLVTLISTDRREQGDKSTCEEALELKLLETLLKETGHTFPVTSREGAMRVIEKHRLAEEHNS